MAKTTQFELKKKSGNANIDELLGDALKATFPASDPIAIAARRSGESARPIVEQRLAANRSGRSGDRN